MGFCPPTRGAGPSSDLIFMFLSISSPNALVWGIVSCRLRLDVFLGLGGDLRILCCCCTTGESSSGACWPTMAGVPPPLLDVALSLDKVDAESAMQPVKHSQCTETRTYRDKETQAKPTVAKSRIGCNWNWKHKKERRKGEISFCSGPTITREIQNAECTGRGRRHPVSLLKWPIRARCVDQSLHRDASVTRSLVSNKGIVTQASLLRWVALSC